MSYSISISYSNSKRPDANRQGKIWPQALVHLAALKPGQALHSIDIAQSNNISKKFLEAILGDLRKASLVHAKKGPGGGYMLARPPEAINIGQAIRELDGPLAPIACASRTAYRPCVDCEDPRKCVVRITMTRVRDAMSEILDHMTLADLTTTKRKKLV